MSEQINEVVVGANVTTIDDHCFQDCVNLAIVDFSQATNLDEIGEYAFSN